MRHVLALLRACVAAAIAANALAAGGATAIVPTLALQQPGARVGWSFGDMGPVRAAGADRKPVVLLITAKGCAACQALMANALRCPTFNTLAGKAHFVAASVSAGGPAAELARSFGPKAYPTVLVLAAGPYGLAERARGAGYMDEGSLMALMARGGLWSKAANPLAPAAVALGGWRPSDCLPARASPAQLAHPPTPHVRAGDGSPLP